MTLLSIIIPAYNVEKYIKSSLQSIFDQFDTRVEVILIDDGSTDNTINIIYSNFIKQIESSYLLIIKQNNSGPGSARNHGLKLCKGKYITFLDADDLFLSNYFKTVVPLLEIETYDIIEHGFLRFISEKDVPLSKFKPLYNYCGSYFLNDIRGEIFANTVWYPSIRIYKKDIWNNLTFTENVFYEDPMTIHKIFLENYLIHFLNFPLLGYRINPNSITAVHTDRHMCDLVNFYFSLNSNTLPVIILKIRLARAILYFYHELNVQENSIIEILSSLKNLKKNTVTMKCVYSKLKIQDYFFIKFTPLYFFINKIRLKYKSKIY